jgi:hypothetical protein
LATRLAREELQPMQLGSVDDVGRIVSWRGRLLRLIHRERVEQTRRLLQSGLLEQLAAAGLLIETTLTDFTSDESELILEHRRLTPLIYPHEWSFSMLQDAATAILAVADAALAAGWNMKDGHAHNLVFDGLQPRFIDIGSFVAVAERDWLPFRQFLRSFYFPLRVWGSGPQLARMSQLDERSLTPREYVLLRRPWSRRLPLRLQQALESVQISSTRQHVRANDADACLRLIVRRLLHRLLACEALDQRSVRRRLAQLRPPTVPRGIGHSADRPAEVLAAAGIAAGTVFLPDVAAVGAVREVLQLSPKLRVLCSHRDDWAVDELYCRLRSDTAARQRLSVAVTDPFRPLGNSVLHPLEERLSADTVVLTAEMLQHRRERGYLPRTVLQRMAVFARKRLLVELPAPALDEFSPHELQLPLLRQYRLGDRTVAEFITGIPAPSALPSPPHSLPLQAAGSD